MNWGDESQEALQVGTSLDCVAFFSVGKKLRLLVLSYGQDISLDSIIYLEEPKEDFWAAFY